MFSKYRKFSINVRMVLIMFWLNFRLLLVCSNVLVLWIVVLVMWMMMGWCFFLGNGVKGFWDVFMDLICSIVLFY